MVFELSLRLRGVQMRTIYIASATFVTVTLALYGVNVIAVCIVTSKLDFYSISVPVSDLSVALARLGFEIVAMFGLLFVIIGAVNIDLFIQICKQKKKWSAGSSFRREVTMLVVVLAIFELGYLVRFTNDLIWARDSNNIADINWFFYLMLA